MHSPVVFSSASRLCTALALGFLTLSSASAQYFDLRIEGTVGSQIPGTGPNEGNPFIYGYERIWYNTTTPSPFGYPTTSEPWDSYYSNRSYRIVGEPVVMSFRIDTSLLPAPVAGSNAASLGYINQLFSWAQSPTLQPYTPWLTGSITLNGITRTYTGDANASISMGDDNALNPAANPRSRFNISFSELTSPIPVYSASTYDFSGLSFGFDLPGVDLFDGVSLTQPLSLTVENAALLAGVNAQFGVLETEWVNGARQTLAQDNGLIAVSRFSMSYSDGSTGPGPGGITPVPEPSTYGLLGAVGLGGLAWWRRRRRA